MTRQQNENWQKFCQTGLISDYLEYRSSVNFSQKGPGLPETSGGSYADFHSGGSGTGTNSR